MQWTDCGSHLEISIPEAFCFRECLKFLGRSELEVLHHIEDDKIYKLIKIHESLILLRISSPDRKLRIEFPDVIPQKEHRQNVVKFITDWFDLERDLSPFYQNALHDKILKPLTDQYFGLRMIGIPDLFEAVTWAIMGQQINLTFAYTLKQRLVENYGECLNVDGRLFWLYPRPGSIAGLEIEELKKLQFTTRKAEYIIGAAKEMSAGRLSKRLLLELKNPREKLISIRGIGAWTADYVLMKCLLEPTAFPIADVGLHNAIKKMMRMEIKPSIDEIKELAKNWSGWEAYATFYLWRSLYE